MLKFSIKNTFRKKITAILACIGVGFGLMLVFVLGAFSAGVTARFQDQLSESIGIIRITEKLKQGSDSHLPLSIPDKLLNTKDVGDHIKKYNGEAQAPAYFTMDYAGQMSGSDQDSLALIGLDLSLDNDWGGSTTKVSDGELFKEGENQIIIDSRLVDKAEFNVDIGKKITINLNISRAVTTDLKIVGV